MQTRSSDEKAVCLSVCLSNAWIVTTEERSVQIFILYERLFSLVFWEKNGLWGQPFLPKILGQPALDGAKSPILNRYSLVAPQP